jgi:hypothetical protein
MKKRSLLPFLLLIIAAVSAIFCIVAAGSTWAANFYCIAPSGTKTSGTNNLTDQGASCYGGGSPIANILANTGGNGPAEDSVIQYNGTDTSSSGSYSYSETVTIQGVYTSVGHPLVIRGRTGDTITVANNGSTWGWTNNQDNVTYQNFTFTGTSGSFGSFNAAGIHWYLTFENCKFNNGAGYGWYGGGITGLRIYNCQFNRNGYSGLAMLNASTGTITDCLFQGNAWNGISTNLSGLTISGTINPVTMTSTCDVSQNRGHGLWHNAGSVAMTVTGCISHENCDDYPTCADGHRFHGFTVGGASNNVT